METSWLTSSPVVGRVTEGQSAGTVASAVACLRAVSEWTGQAPPGQGGGVDEVDALRTVAEDAVRAARSVEAALEEAKWPAVRDSVASAFAASPSAVGGCLACAASWDRGTPGSRAASAAVCAALKDLEEDRSAASALASNLAARCVETVGPEAFDARAAATLFRTVGAGSFSHPEESGRFFRAVETVVDSALNTSSVSSRKSRLSDAATLVAATARKGAVSPQRIALLIEGCASFDLWDAARDAVEAVDDPEPARALVEKALAADRLRQADAYARFFRRLLNDEALFTRAVIAHARSTIQKVTARGQHQIVDKVVRGVRSAGALDVEAARLTAFALDALKATGAHDYAVSLATEWDVVVTDADLEAARRDRLERARGYLQWTDVFPTPSPPLPDLLSAPEDIQRGLEQIVADPGPVGLDVEWDDAVGQPVSVLQLATRRRVLLVDAARLASTPNTQPALLTPLVDAGKRLLGFASASDVKRLSGANLLPSSARVLDIQPLAVAARPSAFLPAGLTLSPDGRLHKKHHPGLAAVAAEFLGGGESPPGADRAHTDSTTWPKRKTLDKSLQCSSWSQRPLSQAQRLYAAMDAIVLVRLYDILLQLPPENSDERPQHPRSGFNEEGQLVDTSSSQSLPSAPDVSSRLPPS